MSKPLALSLVLVAFLFGTGFGFVFTPEYAVMNEAGAAMTAADGKADLRFLLAMGRHHRGAFDLAQSVEAQSERPELVAFAREVQALKTADLAQFSAWKQAWYQDTQPIEAAAPVNLGPRDQDFDLRFLNALEEKLVEAVMMATEQRRVSSRSEILTYASELIRVQSGVIDQVRAWRKGWYGL